MHENAWMWSNQINSQIRQILKIRKMPYAICLVERCLLTSMNFNFIARAQLLVLIICGIKRWYHDIMPAACSRDQFYLKNRSDRTMLVLCWYPPSNAFKQSTWASAPFVDQDLLIIQGAVDFFVCWVLRSLCLPFFWGAVWIYVYVFHLCWGIHVATI